MFQICSDLHSETDNSLPRSGDYINPTAPILILAGDIGRINMPTLFPFLEDICSKFEYVLYVPGNHEFYTTRGYPSLSIKESLRKLYSYREKLPNLHILNRTSLLFGNVCIMGATLWSKAEVDLPPGLVKIDGIDKKAYNKMFFRDLSYIKKMIDHCKSNNYKLVVVTHHPPFKSACTDKFASLYGTDLEDLLSSDKVHTWVYGHDHKNKDIKTKGGTRLFSNQKGKKGSLADDFRKDAILEV